MKGYDVERERKLFFWMSALSNEYISKAFVLLGENDKLNRYIADWDGMSELDRGNVVKDLRKRMIELGWAEEAQEHLS